jgi:hypothetical protein
MIVTRKLKVTGVLSALVILGTAAIQPGDKADYKNLQVLPKDISSKDLQRIMVDEFQDGLGVSCSYCHAPENGSRHLDYASDEKPEKEIARAMMRMTLNVNKQYFNVLHPAIGDSLMIISCTSCHRGNPQAGLENPEK